MTDAKNQHYVPRCLLKHFSINEKIFVFDKNNSQHTYPTNIKNICSQNYFYSFTPNELIKIFPNMKNELDNINLQNSSISKEHIMNKQLYSCEQKLSSLESEAAYIIENILKVENLRNLTFDEKSLLCFFVAVQYLRTESRRDDIKYICDETLQNVKNNYKTKLDNLNKTFEVNKTFEEVCSFCDNSLFQCAVFDSKLFSKFISIENIAERPKLISQILMSKKMFLIKNITGNSFYISDNPVVLHNKNDGNLGHCCKGTQIYLPLSNKIVLAFYDESLVPPINVKSNPSYSEYTLYNAMQNGNSFQCSKSMAKFLNDLQIWYSKRYILSINSDFNQVLSNP